MQGVHKRSLGQGNAFIPIRLFTGGMGSAYKGRRGICLQREGGVGQIPPEPEKRAVHIILECFLVGLGIFAM